MNVNQFKLYINKTDELNLIMRIKQKIFIRVLRQGNIFFYLKILKNIKKNLKIILKLFILF